MPETAKVDDVQKKEGDDSDGVDVGAVPIDALQFGPHDKLVEGEAQGNAINNGEAETNFFASFCREEKVVSEGQENDAVSKVVEMNTTNS